MSHGSTCANFPYTVWWVIKCWHISSTLNIMTWKIGADVRRLRERSISFHQIPSMWVARASTYMIGCKSRVLQPILWLAKSRRRMRQIYWSLSFDTDSHQPAQDHSTLIVALQRPLLGATLGEECAMVITICRTEGAYFTPWLLLVILTNIFGANRNILFVLLWLLVL